MKTILTLALSVLAAPLAFGQGLYTLANDTLLLKTLWQVPTRLGSGFAPSGAVSVNAKYEESGQVAGPSSERSERPGQVAGPSSERSERPGQVAGPSSERSERPGQGTWYIEQQRYGGDYLMAAAFTRNEDTLKTGLTVIDWGFAKQGPTGAFIGTGDPHHSTSFFLEATARALLVLRESKHPKAEELIQKYRDKLAAAAKWMITDDDRAEKHDVKYAHRRWIVAAAYGQVATLTGDPALAEHGALYARKGLAMQREDGVNTEKGGFDVSYHGVGLAMAERYYCACGDPALKAEVAAMLDKGLTWLAGRIDDNGVVNLEGSTRIGGEASESGRSGAVKKPDFKTMVQALSIGAAITPKPLFRDKALLVAKAQGWETP